MEILDMLFPPEPTFPQWEPPPFCAYCQRDLTVDPHPHGAVPGPTVFEGRAYCDPVCKLAFSKTLWLVEEINTAERRLQARN